MAMDEPSIIERLCAGQLDWDALQPFPTADPDDRARADAAVAELTKLLVDQVDPTAVDRDRRLPAGLVDTLRARGYLALRLDPGLGGLGLSPHATFRVVEAAASWSLPVAYVLAVNAGLGVSAYLPLLPAGPLRAELTERIRTGIVSGDADTEPAGAGNRGRATTATRTEDGTGYLLTGSKVFIANAPIADLLTVSATVTEGGREAVRLFVVDTRSPGVTVHSRHQFLGLGGFENAPLTLDRVRVPRHAMLPDQEWFGRDIVAVASVGRMLSVAAPAAAIAKLCLHWSREAAGRRRIDGRPLEDYPHTRDVLAASTAELFALQSVVEWTMLAGDRLDLTLDRFTAKNVTSLSCWRIVERTMSLLGAEGYETASSKAGRGALPVPLERFHRDARALRISGGVDVMVDYWTAEAVLTSPRFAAAPATVPAGSWVDPRLSAANQAHAWTVAAQTADLGRFCRRLVVRHRDPADLLAQQRVLILVGGIARELFTVSVVLARAAALAGREGRDAVQHAAGTYCRLAWHRVAGRWRRLTVAEDEPPTDQPWWRDRHLDGLLDDVITQLPPA